jgi:hypothetical protein
MKAFTIVILSLILVMQIIQTEVAREQHNALAQRANRECEDLRSRGFNVGGTCEYKWPW